MLGSVALLSGRGGRYRRLAGERRIALRELEVGAARRLVRRGLGRSPLDPLARSKIIDRLLVHVTLTPPLMPRPPADRCIETRGEIKARC